MIFFSENYITKGMKISNFSSLFFVFLPFSPHFYHRCFFHKEEREASKKNMADFYGLFLSISLFIISNTINSPNHMNENKIHNLPSFDSSNIEQISSLPFSWPRAVVSSLFVVLLILIS